MTDWLGFWFGAKIFKINQNIDQRNSSDKQYPQDGTWDLVALQSTDISQLSLRWREGRAVVLCHQPCMEISEQEQTV